MHPLRTLILFSCLLLAGAAAAQHAPGKENAAPLLEIKADDGLVDDLLAQLGPVTVQGKVPGPGGHYEVEVSAAGETGIWKRAGDMAGVELRARPGALWDLWRSQLGVPLGLIRGALTMVLIQQGMSGKEAIALFEDLLRVPHQVDELTLTAKSTGPDLVEVDLDLQPAPNTWFSKMCGKLQPRSAGAPALREPDALASLVVAVEPDALPLLLQPVQDLSVMLLTRKPEERERLRDYLRASTDCLDGSLALTVDKDNQRISQLIGIRDPERYRELLASDDHQLLIERMALGAALLHYEHMPSALRHRGVVLARSAVRLQLDRLGVPEGFGESPFVIYTGLAGDAELTMRFDPGYEQDGLDRVRNLVDRLLDHEVRPMPLPDGALLQAELDLTGAGEELDTLFGMLGANFEAPERVVLRVFRSGQGLRLHLRVLL